MSKLTEKEVSTAVDLARLGLGNLAARNLEFLCRALVYQTDRVAEMKKEIEGLRRGCEFGHHAYRLITDGPTEAERVYRCQCGSTDPEGDSCKGIR